MTTIADLLVSRLLRAGTRAIFGMPGGGSNLDVIDAARRAGLPFVLAHTETAGAIMAAAQAEITGAPGACLSTLGPGVSSIVNGVAHACLDRVPLVVLTDAMERPGRVDFEHQNLPHRALLGPITRLSDEITRDNAAAILDDALARARGAPPGPVHLDCTASAMIEAWPTEAPPDPQDLSLYGRAGRASATPAPAPLSPAMIERLQAAERPLVIAGLGARHTDDATAVRRLCERWRMPALVTYKAKGVVPDDNDWYAGLFTLGELERPFVERADLLITIGLDPVELLPRRWPYPQPALHVARWAPATQVPAGDSLIGDIATSLQAVGACARRGSAWAPAEIAAHRDRQRGAVLTKGSGLSPGDAIEVVAEQTRPARHVTVDAGAHMFPAMALVPADRPGRILISNGLSTMGFALPAAIGAALLEPDEPVVAITGDAGLLLCLGELRTAARERLRIIAVVVADDELSLIRIKQDRRGLQPDGVRIGDMDWPLVARGLGWRGSRAVDTVGLRQHLADALEADGPTLIEARVDPTGYGDVLRTIRG